MPQSLSVYGCRVQSKTLNILDLNTHLEGLFAGVSAGHEVVADPDKPVAVLVPVVEAVGSGHQDPVGEDGGGTHEVRLPTGLSEEEGGEPRETPVSWGIGSLAVLVSPDNSASPGTLVRSNKAT